MGTATHLCLQNQPKKVYWALDLVWVALDLLLVALDLLLSLK